jgi:hypothetical protein
VVTVLGRAWHIIQYTPTIAMTNAETKAVRGPALYPRQPGYYLMLVSRCIPYWASGVRAFVVGEKHAGRVKRCVSLRTHGEVEKPALILSTSCSPSENPSNRQSRFASLFDHPTKNRSISGHVRDVRDTRDARLFYLSRCRNLGSSATSCDSRGV